MNGRRTRLLDDYYELRESGSTSDFPNILGNLMYRSLIDWARTIPDVWRSYSAIGDATDFRPLTRIVGNEAEDLVQVLEDGGYVDSKLGDAKYQVQLNTYGRAFSINRNVVINDDLGYIKQQPKRFGKSAARSIANFGAVTLLEGNGTTFDGVALFHATHANLDTGAGSVISSANIQKGISGLQDQTVLNTFISVAAKWLLVPTQLQWTARQILNSAIIVATGGDATIGVAAIQLGNKNVLDGALGLVIDPFLASATGYYVLADPSDVPVIDIVFLNGKQTPDLLIEKPTYMNLAGGDDPYEYEYDILRYKVRYDYGGATSLWWGGYKFNGA